MPINLVKRKRTAWLRCNTRLGNYRNSKRAVAHFLSKSFLSLVLAAGEIRSRILVIVSPPGVLLTFMASSPLSDPSSDSQILFGRCAFT